MIDVAGMICLRIKVKAESGARMESQRGFICKPQLLLESYYPALKTGKLEVKTLNIGYNEARCREIA